jgi:hypothetical protein
MFRQTHHGRFRNVAQSTRWQKAWRLPSLHSGGQPIGLGDEMMSSGGLGSAR